MWRAGPFAASANGSGLGAGVSFSPDELHSEPYRGIRPALGYLTQSDHTEKAALFAPLDASAMIGVSLIGGLRMLPGRVSAGPRYRPSRYLHFGVAKVERDQVGDYAARKACA